MASRQDAVERRCEICLKLIELNAWMLDLFREESAVEGATLRVCWVHERCARLAIQSWLLKKKAKESSNESLG